MPPGKRKTLNEEEVGLIKTWIEKLQSPPRRNSRTTSTNWPATNYSPSPAEAAHRVEAAGRAASGQAVDRFLELAWKLDKIQAGETRRRRRLRPARLSGSRGPHSHRAGSDEFREVARGTNGRGSSTPCWPATNIRGTCARSLILC